METNGMARNIRNEILHNANIELDDLTLNEYLCVFIAVLQDEKCLATYAGSRDAIDKLTRLKLRTVTIVTGEGQKLKDRAMKEINEIKIGTLRHVQHRYTKLIQVSSQGESCPGEISTDSSESKRAMLTEKLCQAVKEKVKRIRGQQTDPAVLQRIGLMLLVKMGDPESYSESTGESAKDEHDSINELYHDLLNHNLFKDGTDEDDFSYSGFSDGTLFSEKSISTTAANMNIDETDSGFSSPATQELLDEIVEAASESDEILKEMVEEDDEVEETVQLSVQDLDQRKGDSYYESGESASHLLLDEIVEAASESDEILKEIVEEDDEVEETVQLSDKDLDQRKGDSFDESGESASYLLLDEIVEAASESDEILKEIVEEDDEVEETVQLSDKDLDQRKGDSFDESGESASHLLSINVRPAETEGPESIDDDEEEDKCRRDAEPTKRSTLYALKDQTEDSLLTGKELNDLCSKEGRTSPGVIKECDKICSFIKEKWEAIVHVWPAYTLNDETAITFVCFMECPIPRPIESNWTLEIRRLGRCTDESKNITYSKDNHPLNTDTARKISSVIDMHSYSLMQKHSYLSAISACSVMYEKNGNDEQKIVPIPCIVLYVLVKHFIPLKEEKYPSKLDAFPVDVREGAFHFCGGSATDYHDNVRMGCAITSTYEPLKHGSLGGFIEHPEYGTCGFTCAHIFLNDERKFKLKEEKVMNEEQLNGCEIFQPLYDREGGKNKIGKLVRLVYKEGSGKKTGLDLAMFKIEQRAPVAGNFPDINGKETALTYDSGKVLGKSGIPFKKRLVQKFGCATKHTHGCIEFDNATVRESYFHSGMQVGANSLTTTLYKQYQIKSTDKSIMFSNLGDSGALVFINDETGKEHEMRCIGMVVGVWNNNTCAVTPIADILKALDVNSLLSFNLSKTFDHIDRSIQTMSKTHDARLEALDENSAKRLREMDEKIERRLNAMEERNERHMNLRDRSIQTDSKTHDERLKALDENNEKRLREMEERIERRLKDMEERNKKLIEKMFKK